MTTYQYYLVIAFTLLAGPVSAKGVLIKAPNSALPADALSTGYGKCRQDVLAQAEKGPPKGTNLKLSLAGCRDRFPAAAAFDDCKDGAKKTAELDKLHGRQALRQCKKSAETLQLSPNNPLPLILAGGKVYFGGIGLNVPTNLQGLTIPDYSCKSFDKSAKAPQDAEYFLFGNHPRWFSRFAPLTSAEMGRLLATKPGVLGNDGVLVDDFGKLFGPLSSSDSLVYFPMGSCSFTSSPGKALSGMNVYYLLDYESQNAIPYFGIAFYKDRKYVPRVKELEARLLNLLNRGGGEKYQIAAHSKDTVYFASDLLKEFDDEGDPKNVCITPRRHDVIAGIKRRTGKLDYPEYVMVANVKNLCRFGDLLSRRFK